MSRRRPAHELRIAIDCLPLGTRKAMLEGMDLNKIIVGAYVDRSGGVCPMLAAHRNGGRTSLASFARAWDRYTRVRKPRPASERELRTLRTMLEASIALDDPGVTELSEAIAEHKATVAEPSAPVAEPMAPVAEPKAPVAEPKAPVAEPKAPVAEPKAPVAEPVAPVAEPVAPVAEPKAPVAEPKRRPRETGETHRAPELRETEGWAWTRPFRRLDDLELVVREVRAMERERARREKVRQRERQAELV